MRMSYIKDSGAPLNTLKRFLVPANKKRAGEVCEMCGQEILPEHSHLVNVESRSLLCSCRSCYLLFTHSGAAQGKYKAVPDRYLHLRWFQMGDAQWEQMQIPVGMAFFFFNSSLKRITAFYPSPAGATESMLSLEAWQQLTDANPVLVDIAADVEALLVYRRRGGSDFECFLVPIDACYELTGRVRKTWKGFDGGEQAWHEIEEFFVNLRGKCPESHLGAQP